MIEGIEKQNGLYAVGFYSASEPWIAQTWRPREEDPEECDLAEAASRLRALCMSMGASEPVDGLVPASVFLRDAETGEVLLSRTSDGFQTVCPPGGRFADVDHARLALLAMVAAHHANPEVTQALEEAARTTGGEFAA
jgi:hypothetical protein